MNFAALDVIFIALIIIFTVRCAIKGFVGEVMSMASIILGLLAAIFFYKKGGEFVRGRFLPDVKILPEIIAFAALFLIIFIAVKIIEFLLREIIEGIKLGGADRVLGIFFGAAEGIVVVSLVLFLLNIQPLFDPGPMFADSFFARLLLPLIAGAGKAGV